MITTGPSYPKFPHAIEIYPKFIIITKKLFVIKFYQKRKNLSIYLVTFSRTFRDIDYLRHLFSQGIKF